jgi:metal-responsive CopG/Arc/MetJ family transcriptional regulator
MTMVILDGTLSGSSEAAMPKVATKVAVSIPNDLYREVERARKKSRKSRSAVMQDALRSWLKQEAQAVLVREYEAGYRKRPESRREVKAAEAAAVRLLAAEEW